MATPEELIKQVGTLHIGKQFTFELVRGSHHLSFTEVQAASAYLGANVKDPRVGPGALVHDVAPGSPAVEAGIQPHDVIVGIDETNVKTVQDLLDAIGTYVPGATVDVTIIRGSRGIKVEATLAPRP